MNSEHPDESVSETVDVLNSSLVSQLDREKVSAREASDYFINTAPEMDALERAAADGKHGRHYSADEQEKALRHAIPGASHHVHLSLTIAEEMAGLTAITLEQLTKEQDADAALAFLYIARVLAPPSLQAIQDFAGGGIDFDDVLSKIGWDPRSTEERREMHKRIYQFILFGERARVIGNRRGKYKDKHTGEVINTVISSPLWRVIRTETPDQQSLFPLQEIPVRVDLVLSNEWRALLTSPQTAQYLPMGEKLGAIPGNKPSGAWARVIGLALASFWRRNPREAVEGTLKPTRRELLERYPPKTGTVEDVHSSTKPMRAVEYWCGALEILVETGLLSKTGEAAIGVKHQKDRLPRQGWFDRWLDETVELRPGPLLEEAIVGRIAALPNPDPPRKRGRPKKAK
jgi:hypothetical protein